MQSIRGEFKTALSPTGRNDYVKKKHEGACKSAVEWRRHDSVRIFKEKKRTQRHIKSKETARKESLGSGGSQCEEDRGDRRPGNMKLKIAMIRTFVAFEKGRGEIFKSSVAGRGKTEYGDDAQMNRRAREGN